MHRYYRQRGERAEVQRPSAKTKSLCALDNASAAAPPSYLWEQPAQTDRSLLVMVRNRTR